MRLRRVSGPFRGNGGGLRGWHVTASKRRSQPWQWEHAQYYGHSLGHWQERRQLACRGDLTGADGRAAAALSHDHQENHPRSELISWVWADLLRLARVRREVIPVVVELVWLLICFRSNFDLVDELCGLQPQAGPSAPTNRWRLSLQPPHHKHAGSTALTLHS
jgi:hypothetical protein